MKTVEVVTIHFKNDLHLNQVQSFRKAISAVISEWRPLFQKNGIATDLFHNHDENTGKNINRYPLIQFRSINKKAALTGIAEGAKALDFFADELIKNDGTAISIDKLKHKLSVERIIKKEHYLQKQDGYKKYFLENWLPMDDQVFAEWEDNTQLNKRVILLDAALQRQLTKLLAICGYEKKFKAYLSEILKSGWFQEYNFTKMSFDVIFHCNANLPEEVGIGQVPSIGCGRIYSM